MTKEAHHLYYCSIFFFSITTVHARLNGDEFDPIFTSVIDQIKELKIDSMDHISDHPVRLLANDKLAHAIYHYNIAGENYEQNQNIFQKEISMHWSQGAILFSH